jgi:hypothetical protein
MTKKRKKFTAEKKLDIFLITNSNLVIPKPPLKDAQATGEAFSPQKRTSRTSKHENSLLFLYL